MMGDFNDKDNGEYMAIKKNRERKQNYWFIAFLLLVILIQALVSFFSLFNMNKIVKGIPYVEPNCAITPIGEIFLRPMIVISCLPAVIFPIILNVRKKFLLFFSFIAVEVILLLINVILFLIIAPNYPYETIIYCLDHPFIKIRLLFWMESIIAGILILFSIVYFIFLHFKKRSKMEKGQMV